MSLQYEPASRTYHVNLRLPVNYLEMFSGSEAGSYVRRNDVCITQFCVVTGAGDAKKVAAAAAERKAREKAARQVPL